MKKTNRKKPLKIISLTLCVLIVSLFLVKIIIPHYVTRNGLCALAYHGVVSDEEKQTEYKDDIYTLSLSQFEEHMKYLYDNGFTTYSMDEVYSYMNGELQIAEKAVVLTFDDGYKNFNDNVKPVLEKYDFKGTCFVIGKHLTDNIEKFLKLEDIENTENVEYYSHSHDLHRKSEKGINRKVIQELTAEELLADFNTDLIDDTYFAFPYGRRAKGIDRVLEEAGVKLAFDYNHLRHLTPNDNPYALPRYMIIDFTPFTYFKWIVE